MKLWTLILTFFCTSIFMGCTKKNRFQVEVFKNKTDVRINRFDLDLICLDTNHVAAGVDSLYQKYPLFLPLYIHNLTGYMPKARDSVAFMLSDFIRSPLVNEVNRKVSDVFGDISYIEHELSIAYSYLHHYFPKLDLPELYFFVSGLNLPSITDNRQHNLVAMGVDFYLGSDYDTYQTIVYDYKLPQMRPEILSVKMMSEVLHGAFRFDSPKERLLDHMLYQGKIFFLLSIVMPDRKDSDIIGYLPEQYEWAQNHEEQIWQTVVGQKHLFSSDRQLISQYMNDTPFTMPISQDSPGRLGQWLGYRIVKSYMDKNKKTTLPELMQTNDYQFILGKSEY